jgi:N-acetylneuraminic acid mutarotase
MTHSRPLFETLESRRLMAATRLRIDVGGDGVTESSGKVWQADRGYTAGVTAGAGDDLYASRRYGNFSYSLPIKSGTYKVKFLFFEPTHSSAGQRVFDVVAERKTILNDFDIAAAGGANTPVVKTATVTVKDGRLNLWFQSVTDNAIVSGIEVTPIQSGPGPQSGLTWKQVADAPENKFESMGDVVNGKLYVIGGYINASIKTTAQVTSYDPAVNRWRLLGDMPEKLTHSGTANDGSFIYLAGGYVGDWQGATTAVTRHVWRYDTATDTWTPMISLPANRAAGALVRVGRKLHFFGGLDQKKRDMGDHWVLDLRHPTKWITAQSMPNPRNHLGGIETGGKIYAIGGQHDLDEDHGNDAEVDAYDVVTGAWSPVASLPRVTSHVHNATFVLGGEVMIAGGSTTGEASISDILEYSPATNAWRTAGELPVALSATVADVLNGHIIVTGGTSSSSQPRNDTWINV